MKRLVIQTPLFSKSLDKLVVENKITEDDYSKFEQYLIYHPDEGDVVPGTGGLRKTRLASNTKGKRGGFRVYYCDFPEYDRLYLMAIYGKNIQEDLTIDEKKSCMNFIQLIKKEISK